MKRIVHRYRKTCRKRLLWLVTVLCFCGLESTIASTALALSPTGSVTVLFYMNGDNDLTDEVLSAVDLIETIGSSTDFNIVALVDGHPKGVARFGEQWAGTHLLHVTADNQPGQIQSTVLADWGELDMGDPETLAQFVQASVKRFPADRYIFCTFAHGKGVIDTGNLTASPNSKSLCISPDATSRSMMPLDAFAGALKKGLGGRRFSMMVLFSCLSGMLEIGYALSDVTDYLIASEDEIRIVNNPPGTHQLRGIPFDVLLRRLQNNPEIPDAVLGRSVINRFIEPYTREVAVPGPDGRERYYRYPASLTLVDCRSIRPLVTGIDELAIQLIADLNRAETALPTLASVQTALRRSQTFKSFLNLQYYDLLDWLDVIAAASSSEDVREISRRNAAILRTSVIRFERHTDDAGANGLSIFFNHPLVPENIYDAHLDMYRQTQFSQDTRWDELIDTYRARTKIR